ncbi:hypothetical protein Sinac_5824 [Singulisphaera acidiphila DSM 18658]|uniref:Uncharacterized protein n=1 Tax=Singulisphaera acidiphila (strain ATCC BAA-1392 / DSM 18658 / VKM B-2454 / MOB10) TaxID=886293 RepID=L0DMR2_SINAD|nr:hypothetical protein Sinac_5824 [Singulisphaera acidiphila DSM 18658]
MSIGNCPPSIAGHSVLMTTFSHRGEGCIWGRSDLKKKLLVGIGRCRLGEESISNQRANTASRFSRDPLGYWKLPSHIGLEFEVAYDFGKALLTSSVRFHGELSLSAFPILHSAAFYKTSA